MCRHRIPPFLGFASFPLLTTLSPRCASMGALPNPSSSVIGASRSRARHDIGGGSQTFGANWSRCSLPCRRGAHRWEPCRTRAHPLLAPPGAAHDTTSAADLRHSARTGRAAHYRVAEVRIDGSLAEPELIRYWRLPEPRTTRHRRRISDIRRELVAQLEEAVRLRLISDVPL